MFNYEEKYTSDRLKIYRREIKQKRYYMIDTKLEELTEENFNELYDKEIFPIIEDDFNQAKNSMRYELFIVFIISVDRMSPMFNRFINTLDQDKRYYKLPIGVSFGGNKMYIPNEIEGFGLMQFNHLKKEFKKYFFTDIDDLYNSIGNRYNKKIISDYCNKYIEMQKDVTNKLVDEIVVRGFEYED